MNLAKNLSINASILENTIGAGKVAELISISSNGINMSLNTVSRSTKDDYSIQKTKISLQQYNTAILEIFNQDKKGLRKEK